MKTVELFCGTKSFSNVMQAHGHSIFTVDNQTVFKPHLLTDILSERNDSFHSEMLWASPPCQGFSVAVIGRNWNYDGTPKTDSARLAMSLAKKTLSIIEESKPRWWFIENPRGMLRKMDFMHEFMSRHGGGYAYCHLLPVRRLTTEANRYLDECEMVDAATRLRAWRTLSCCSASRFSHRHSGNKRRD